MRRWSRAILWGAGVALFWGLVRGEPATIGQEPRGGPAAGRNRPPMPPITRPLMFNTPEADRILTALQVFPPDNPWNMDISNRPLHPNSRRLVASVGEDKRLACNLDMGFILVPPEQKRVPVKLTGYPDESDPGPFPVPENAPIEDWPLNGKPLEVIQREGRGDRHMLVVDP